MSELCLGTMTFEREADEATSHAILDRFVAAGGSFIDTANVYGRGRSEEVVGSWLLQRPGVTAPIIGARTVDQLNDNLGAGNFVLDAEQMQQLDDASDVVLPYPYDFLANAVKRR